MRAESVECAILSPETLPLFLKSIDIAGFKSFARPVRLELPPGITALVGPNGSGKSNIVDALRWAMGEQNVRDLRGQRSDDVIHVGPRRSLGLAEVTLTLDASDRPDGIAEIAVGRRLYRSGESEYLVQGRKGRLRDLQDALRGIGIAGADTVVVNQGMADALLTATASERRLILEHAAGLAGYRARREEARHKLQATAQNIGTIEMVLAELEPRLRVLRRQARAVRDREEARDRLTATLQTWYAARWAELRGRLASLTERCAAESRERERLVAGLRALEEAYEASLTAEREWRRRLDVAQAGVHATQRELDAARFSLRAVEQQLASARRALADGTARYAEAETVAVGVRARHSEALQSAAALALEREGVIDAMAAQQQTLERAASSLAEAQAALQSASTDQVQCERLLAQLTAACTGLEHSLDRDRRRLEDIEARLASLQEEREVAEQERQRQQTSLQQAGAAAVEARERLARSESDRVSARARSERAERVLRHLRARQESVARRQRTFEHAVTALAPALEATLLRRTTVCPGWESAVAAALGTWPLEGRSTRGAAGELERFLAWRGRLDGLIGDARWADTLSATPVTGVTPLHATLLVEDRPAAERLWTCLASEPAHLIGSPPLRVITRRGDVVWTLEGAFLPAADSGGRYLHARRELEVCVVRGARLEDWVVRASAAVSQARKWLQRCNEDLEALDSMRRAAEDARETAEVAVRGTERKLGALRREAEALDAKRQQAAMSILSAERLLADREVELSDLTDRLAAVRARLQGLHAAVEGARTHAEEAERARRDLEHRLALLAAREESELKAAGSLAGQLAHLEQQMQAWIETKERDRAEQERAGELLAQEQERVQGLTELLGEQQERLARMHDERPELPLDRGNLEATRTRLAERVREHERLLAQQAQCEDERDRLQVEILTDLRQAPELLGDPEGEIPSEDEIRRLRLRANQYPDADMTAVRECEELEERYVRLRTSVEDLNDAARELDGIIALADREMRFRFDQTFAALNEEFGRVFRVMLRGGDAALEQTEDGGVGVRAQLPGKRARSSASFSGGEKALVASSLLFAVLRLRPTPFVVLDEVDAALDESNVDRYVAALRDISERTQVIIVTHNRATMEAADVLYGVTMDDEGVSRLLSLRLDAYAAVG